MKQHRITYPSENSVSYRRDKILAAIIHQVVEAADPDKIILFGSRAKGKQKKDSDYDICVIKKSASRKLLEEKIYCNLSVEKSVDVVVTTPYFYQKLKDKWFLIYSEINRIGKVIYEK